ncbi:MAG: glycerate kinase [Bacteroidales bacterium]|jgi:glycerate kinase|nr:glycerate kinase [Bacteroidales bacterium]
MRSLFNIVIASDKFKGSLTASEASMSIAHGLRLGAAARDLPYDLKVNVIPMADGGEGFLSVAGRSDFFKRKEVMVYEPLGRSFKSYYLLSEEKAFAVIEMAMACGLGLLEKDEYNPLEATTFGLGQLISAAIEEGVTHIIIGIGGSATNDGGTGMLQALGYSFRDKNGNEIRGGEDEFMSGSVLQNICTIDDTLVKKELRRVKFTVACDVDNPLLGPAGATYVYAAQKGADDSELVILESGMRNFAEAAERYLGFKSSFLCDSSSFVGFDFSDFPGSGAAGGVGFATRSFLNAELIPGWRVAAELSGADDAISNADLVISGEGRLDSQTLSGKLVEGIAILSKRYDKPVWVFCGENLLTQDELKEAHIERVFEIVKKSHSINDSMSRAKELLEKISQESATFLPELQSNRQTN